MRKIGILGLVGILALFLSGCGGGDGPGTVIVQALSDTPADGDVGVTTSSAVLISQADAAGTVQYGTDAAGTEFRAFLDFPLDGSTGGDAIPLGAVIVSADIEVFVNSVSFATSVPTLLELVTFPITGLTAGDFSSAPLLTRSAFNIRSLDVNNFVRIDVTSLMAEAQRRGLRDLQLRFLLDFVPGAAGLVAFDDGLVAARRPLLTVEYR